MKTICFSILTLLIVQKALAQEGMPFSENQKLYVRGSSILIGNNILGDHTTKPLIDLAIPNDKVKMKYIDVDDDDRTFSSSQATINVSDKDSKIAYAGLYWSALYPYQSGVLRKSGNRMVYKGQGERDAIVNTILFKTPNEEYKTINGEVIFDSFGREDFSTNVPYACYADVTLQLQELSTFNGTYTVGNVKATEGNISGGSSGGWLLYIIYENPEESAKYFTSYQGLVEVNKEAVELTFKDFKTKEIGAIDTTIAIGSLEGDTNFKTDECAIYNSKTESFENISNALRPSKNFFNSKITIYSEMFNDRNPNNSNTLGFDILKIKVPNFENQTIDGSTTQATLRFKTKADRFYLFFVAFETEINDVFYQDKRELGALDRTDEDTLSSIKESTEEAVLSVRDILETKEPKQIKTAEKDTQDKQNAIIEKIINKKSISVPSLNSGYYLVTNVFSNISYAKRWADFLTQKGFSPKTYINPKNNWHYIYIFQDMDPYLVNSKRDEIKNIDYFKEVWIIKINL